MNIVFEYEELAWQLHLKRYLSNAANFMEPSRGRATCMSITYLRLQMFQGFICGLAEDNPNATASFQLVNFIQQSLPLVKDSLALPEDLSLGNIILSTLHSGTEGR